MADGYPEIFIPGAAQYQDALDLHVNKALAGQESAQEALDAVAAEWEEITDKLGREQQTELWNKALVTYQELGLVQ
jgi:multiple sugar transport system substrate-binding protein